MPDFVTLSCPSCGGKLEITPDIERFACGYCGNEHIVRRGGGIISLIPVAEDIKGIRTGVDKTAAELAINRIKKEIEELDNGYNLRKRQILSNRFDNYGNLDDVANLFIIRLYNFKGKKNIYLFEKKNNGLLFTMLSPDDINYGLTNWNNFWEPKALKENKVSSLFDVLIEAQKTMDELAEKILQKKSELENMQKIVNS